MTPGIVLVSVASHATGLRLSVIPASTLGETTLPCLALFLSSVNGMRGSCSASVVYELLDGIRIAPPQASTHRAMVRVRLRVGANDGTPIVIALGPASSMR
jgi:hypothetical protein